MRDVTPYSADIRTGSDVTESDDFATVAIETPRSRRSIRVTSSSFDMQFPLTDGEAAKTLNCIMCTPLFAMKGN